MVMEKSKDTDECEVISQPAKTAKTDKAGQYRQVVAEIAHAKSLQVKSSRFTITRRKYMSKVPFVRSRFNAFFFLEKGFAMQLLSDMLSQAS